MEVFGVKKPLNGTTYLRKVPDCTPCEIATFGPFEHFPRLSHRLQPFELALYLCLGLLSLPNELFLYLAPLI